MFGSVLRVLGYEDLLGIDISERMLEKSGEKNAYRTLHRMVLGELLSFDDGSFSAAICLIHRKCLTLDEASLFRVRQ